jgi:hypothetical protein
MKRTSAILSVLVLIASVSAHAQADIAKPKKATLPVILNILPGIGIGSFVQGDPLGGVIEDGAGLVFGGMIYGYANLIGAIFSGMTGKVDSRIDEGLSASVYLVIGGAVLWTGTKVFEIARPIAFARRYNEEHGLARATLSPTLVPTGASGIDSLAPGLSFHLSY